MPFKICLGCNEQKRSKNDKFYGMSHLENPLLTINCLRQTQNAKKRKLEVLRDMPQNGQLCKSCYEISKKPKISQLTESHTPDLSIYRRGNSSHGRCTFGCKNIQNLISVPKAISHELLMNYKFLILPDSRMCSSHIGIPNYWPLVKQISAIVSEKEQESVSNIMYKYYQEMKSSQKAVFDINAIDRIGDEIFKDWFAYSIIEFQRICSYAKTCQPKHIAVLLCKLRTSLSNNQLAFLFGVSDQTIANYMNLAREDLLKNLVPQFINNNYRSVLLSHNTEMAKILFDITDDKACLVFDATYRLVQKSSNFAGQKQLWSEQKKMPLVKPMVACAPDGYILFVLGPFDARHNDATILEDCFCRFADKLHTIAEGDHILVDRGFRDVLHFLTESKKLNVHCPGLGQLETMEANMSRFVTRCRWIIEQVFGRLKKKFKYFALPAHNATLNHDFGYLLIAFALLNLFHKPVLSDKLHQDIAQIMKSRVNVPNRLKLIAQDFNLSQLKAPYLDMEYTALDNEENNQRLQFPRLTLDHLYHLGLGPYQTRNAASYYAEHTNEGIFLVQKFSPPPRHRTATIDYARYEIDVKNPLLIKAYMKSRYRSGKYHHIFILVDKAKTGRDSILEYYCTCESGSRTVGCCSHVMTIVWYLGYAQYEGVHIPNPDICDISISIRKEVDSHT
ncbi:uncharacterized protein LOC131667948 [Phymastichus coffea]|uniref:uncharacterized protein LOC131667948 n=1 Tax=Phymastichus coffea TaxID=108790 RepID=UPI00273C0A5D|nr:uncharacterized protein LOC131667948 [Phymastichus coffea]